MATRRTTRTTEPPLRGVASCLVALAGVAVAAVLVHRFAAFTTLVRSGSMRPTLEPGDLLLTARVHRSTQVRRGDLVVFASRERGGVLVKRVVGLPGEHVEIDGGSSRVDGTPLAEPYAQPSGGYRGSFAVPGDAYLLLGDAREASDDARSWDDPYVRRRDLRGVVRGRMLRTRARRGTAAPHGDGIDVVLAASAVVTDAAGRVLLVKRGRDPQRRRWSVPGGRVEPGESLGEAAAREVLEETGLRVDVGRELWSARLPTGDGREFEIHDFAATVTGGALRAGDDADDARWVEPGSVATLRLTSRLAEHLRRAGIVPRLPHVDEHAVEIAADRAAVWSALERVVDRAAPSWFSRVLGCDDTAPSGPRPLAEGSSVPGFHVVSADHPSRLVLAGRHRYSEYELAFRIDDLGDGRSRLRAETRAIFPGGLGAVYRMLLMGTGAHVLATRRILAHVARRAVAPR